MCSLEGSQCLSACTVYLLSFLKSFSNTEKLCFKTKISVECNPVMSLQVLIRSFVLILTVKKVNQWLTQWTKKHHSEYLENAGKEHSRLTVCSDFRKENLPQGNWAVCGSAQVVPAVSQAASLSPCFIAFVLYSKININKSLQLDTLIQTEMYLTPYSHYNWRGLWLGCFT